MPNTEYHSDVVDWEGPDDPANPKNWSSTRKVLATMTIALISILTYVFEISVRPHVER
jgi:hypothetical protein